MSLQACELLTQSPDRVHTFVKHMPKRRPKDTGSVAHVFVKPAWHWGLPLFVLLLIWGLFAAYAFLPHIKFHTNLLAWIQSHIFDLWKKGYTPAKLLPTLIFASVLLSGLVYRGRYRLTITYDAITRLSPLGEPLQLRWVDVEEVYIRRIQYPLEGRERERRVLVLYGKRRRWWPFRPKLVLTNWQFQGYREAERLAIKIAVPAIAERLRAKLIRESGIVEFGRPSFADDLRTVLFLAAGLAAAILMWRFAREAHLLTAAIFGIVTVLAFVESTRSYRPRWFGVDLDHLYVFRRGRRTLKIPLTSLTEAHVTKGVMKIVASPHSPDAAEVTIREKRFFRNRGVMLALIRIIVRDKLLSAPHPADAQESEAIVGETEEIYPEGSDRDTVGSAAAPASPTMRSDQEDLTRTELSEELDP